MLSGEASEASKRSSDLSIDRDLVCPVCFQTLKDPFLTACGHSFCYGCISVHLRRKNDCPCCSEYLNSSMMYPNIHLEKVLKKLLIAKSLLRASPAEHLRIALQNGTEMSIQEINSLLGLLTDHKARVERTEAEENMLFLLELLHELHSRKQKELHMVENDLENLEEDLVSLRNERRELQLVRDSYLLKFSAPATRDTSTSSSQVSSGNSARPSSKRKHELMLKEHEVLGECYTEECRRARSQRLERGQNGEPSGQRPGLVRFRSSLSGFFRYRKIQMVSETCQEQSSSPHSNIISSIDFDRDDEFFATAGVSGHLRVFEYAKVPEVWNPNADIQTRSKMSCVSWDNHRKNFIAACDYDGVVKVWDVMSCQIISNYDEHEKRAWSVDYSPLEPSRLASGGDDGKIKIWSRELKSSVLTVDVKANICSVKHNPTSSNFVAAASADHRVYYYDLRQTKSPLHLFGGHEKAVSYVKFMSSSLMVSASTDGTLRLWDLESLTSLRTYGGHTNEKNFVGLSVNAEYIACGSETNDVFVYHKGITKAALTHGFPHKNCDDHTEFISSVCWKRSDVTTMIAANSQGVLRALMLAT